MSKIIVGGQRKKTSGSADRSSRNIRCSQEKEGERHFKEKVSKETETNGTLEKERKV